MSAFLRTASRTSAVRTAARAFSTTTPRPVARITVVGNLAAPPELQATSTGNEIIRYAVASSSGPRDNRVTSWFNVTSFEQEGPRRDYLQSIPKGALVYVEGDATMSSYTDSEGKPRKALNIVQRHLEVLRRPADHSGQE
ncbi:nucleic acid-binding protein [Podospora aff. communis PSN243]|uniref:Nucleic acid-binding protein n=1 Tax=Podospora aff. communis PSN243 TaxID=3040156 RepID=A0AAV9H8S2_9PEZI|nr:nucleic acid-binding protein [Podospora aff. communis PSN243]